MSSEQDAPPDQPSYFISQPSARCADCRVRKSAIVSARKAVPFSIAAAKSSTASIVPNSPACPDAPPSANAFSSCTSPRSMRSRHWQNSVAAQSSGSGAKVKPVSSVLLLRAAFP